MPALRAYRALGYRKFEVFTGWARSAVSIEEDPEAYRRLADGIGMRLSSFHLPPIDPEGFETSLERAVKATCFAMELGATHVIFKAADRPTYIRAAGAYLDAIEGLPVTPVLQNHSGTAISTLEDFREVVQGIADERMRSLLEVGHFHRVGVSWKQAYSQLESSVALVHLKDMQGDDSVAFGSGEIDLKGLFARLFEDGYAGDFVVEMEARTGVDNLRLLGETVKFLSKIDGVRL